MRIFWLAIKGPGVSRMTYWNGRTKQVLITGLTREFVDNCPCSVELPEGAEIHAMPCSLDGYVFTVGESFSNSGG